MATRETRRERGRRQGEAAGRRLAYELRTARQLNGLSQLAAAELAGWTQSEISRFERDRFPAVALPRLCQLAAVLGFELSVGLHPAGNAVRDKGHQAAVGRLLEHVSPLFRRAREAAFPNPGDRRSWDLLLRANGQLIGVEVETRIRDVQALVRRIRERERDGGADEILLVLSDTAHNRLLVGQLREALGPRYSTSSRQILSALRAGRPVPGSGVVLV